MDFEQVAIAWHCFYFGSCVGVLLLWEFVGFLLRTLFRYLGKKQFSDLIVAKAV